MFTQLMRVTKVKIINKIMEIKDSVGIKDGEFDFPLLSKVSFPNKALETSEPAICGAKGRPADQPFSKAQITRGGKLV